MRTIYKYPLQPGTNTIELPEGAQILSTAAINGEPVIYAIVDPEEIKKVNIDIYVYGTGQQPWHYTMPEPDIRGYDMTFIGTVNCEGLMWHVFVKNPQLS